MPFEKGVSGNPGGRRTKKPITDALCTILSDKTTAVLKLPKNATIAHELALTMITKARAGDKDLIKEVIDRVEGKAAASISVDHSGAIAVFSPELSPTLIFLKQQAALGSDNDFPAALPDRPLLPAPVRA